MVGVWEDRPVLPNQPVYEHLPPQATVSRAEKLAQLREELKNRGADWHFIATLDDIAWLFNLRGADVSYLPSFPTRRSSDLRGADVSFNPVFVSFALVNQQQATLFVALDKVSAELEQILKDDGVILRDYAEIAVALAAVPGGSSLLVDPARVTCGLLDNLHADVRLVEGLNPTTLAKSRKSLDDAVHIRQAMEQDGAALCEFFAWLETALGRERITELTIDEKLTAARARRPDYVSLSFNTIAAFNANGAMPHYHATEQEHAVIEGDTTEIYTLSLHDALPIWADNVNYGHGTGHGVGYFLNVHEGPQVIAYQAVAAPQTAMQPGMITSIEPGTYRPGRWGVRWGVRIENLAMNREAGESEFGEFLRFETLTLCPIDTRCLEPALLTQEERDWLNGYHVEVRERLSPWVSGAALEWLNTRTAAI